MMTTIRTSALALLFGALAIPAPAQETKPPAQKPPATEQGPPAPSQEPEAVDTPEARVERLKQQKAVLEQELVFVENLQKTGGMGELLVDWLRHRKLDYRSIDAGKSAHTLPTGAESQPATPFSEEQKAKYAADVIGTIEGRVVREQDLQSLVAYLGKFPSSGTDQQRKTRALFELIRTEVAHAAFAAAAAEAEVTIREIRQSLERGVEFAHLAKNRSRDPSAEKEGDLGWITRNSPHGLKIEQVAFDTAENEVSEVFRTQLGFNLLRVTAREKGETENEEKVRASLILIPYLDDMTEVRQVQSKFAQGQVALSFRDKELIELLPPMYR